MAAEVHLTATRVRKQRVDQDEPEHLMTPGDVITSDTGFMRGHGTYVEAENKLQASVAGLVERYNKLICVKPLKTRYNGEVGDVVIGRIAEVGQKRWKVETHSKLDSVLMLSSVNLPGGELRRRSEEDERLMRDYLAEGDLISAEVQNVFHDGVLSLHTRSLKYGKLGQGVLVQVSPSLVKRRKTHFHNLPCGASIIIGNNGYIWISPTVNEDTDNTGGFIQNLELEWDRLYPSSVKIATNHVITTNGIKFTSIQSLFCFKCQIVKQPVAKTDREVIARLRNCVLALAHHKCMVFDTSILYTFEASSKFLIKDLLKPEVMDEITELTRLRLEQEL